MIGVDVLADQHDLANAGIGEAFGLGDDFFDRPRQFGAARVGHNAEGAELVAALLHGDEAGDAALRVAARLGGGRCLNLSSIGNSVSIDFFGFAARCAPSIVGQPVIALRADHEIDSALAPDDLFALGLGNAARDRDRHAASVPPPRSSLMTRMRPSSE